MTILVPGAVLCAAVTVALFYLQQHYLPMNTMTLLGTLLGTVFVAALLFGPSRFILSVVFIYALTGHQFRSLVVIPFLGVEWHPRELLLLLLLAHGFLQILRGRFWIHWSPIHLGMLLYTAFFAYAAWRGLQLGNGSQAVIAELRAPLFLAAFWVFAGCIRSPRDLYYYGYLALCVVTLWSVATLAVFVGAAMTGPWPNMQNALGEFVPRGVLGRVLLSVRPSGHAMMEAGLILCVGMFCCPREPWFRRAIYLGLGTLFSGAIAVGFMRTALISLAISLLFLAWLNLPRRAKGMATGLALLVALGVGIFLYQNSPSSFVTGSTSLNARYVESSGAITAMDAHPFFGAGLGASFEALGLVAKTSNFSAIPTRYDSLHNVWLYFAWKGGLVGLAMVVVALVGMLLYSNRITKQLPTMSLRCVARCLQAVLLGQLVASCTMARLTYANGALFLVIWAMAFVLLDTMRVKPHPTRTVHYGNDGQELPSDEDDAGEDDGPSPRQPAAKRHFPNVSTTLEQL